MAEKAQSDGDASAVSPVSPVSPTSPSVALESQPTTPRTAQEEPIDDNSGKSRRKRWFRRTSAGGSHESGKPGNVGSIEGYHEEAEDDAPSAVHIAPVDHGFGYGDDARMELG